MEIYTYEDDVVDKYEDDSRKHDEVYFDDHYYYDDENDEQEKEIEVCYKENVDVPYRQASTGKSDIYCAKLFELKKISVHIKQ